MQTLYYPPSDQSRSCTRPAEGSTREGKGILTRVSGTPSRHAYRCEQIWKSRSEKHVISLKQLRPNLSVEIVFGTLPHSFEVVSPGGAKSNVDNGRIGIGTRPAKCSRQIRRKKGTRARPKRESRFVPGAQIFSYTPTRGARSSRAINTSGPMQAWRRGERPNPRSFWRTARSNRRGPGDWGGVRATR